jgi:hypothetical protein
VYLRGKENACDGYNNENTISELVRMDATFILFRLSPSSRFRLRIPLCHV